MDSPEAGSDFKRQNRPTEIESEDSIPSLDSKFVEVSKKGNSKATDLEGGGFRRRRGPDMEGDDNGDVMTGEGFRKGRGPNYNDSESEREEEEMETKEE